MKCIYYPGCSQKASSISYEKSFLAIAKLLDVEVIELDDWNCCGTTVTISVNETLSLTLAARNLAIAEPRKLPIVAPCPSCYITLSKVNKHFKENSPFVEKINSSLEKGNLHYNGKAEVFNILDFLVNKVGIEKIAKKVTRPLTGVRIAPYYGCQIVNPYATGDDNTNPQNLELIIEALGGTPVDFPHRTTCCSGSLMITKKPHAEEMSITILKSIDKAKSDLIVTPCGLCQINLDAGKSVSSHYLNKKLAIPVLSVTQLIGIALGIQNTSLGISKNAMKPYGKLAVTS
ncbi:MAG: CoB--CoM heterodisulfide reductase iron-sulfur subunit B family protein [Bacteroidetes bacterium]|nr:CoB--CoM heterodisulfide reductase iron-sulfur subunit B family protein [Bacteroidota bacterium]